MGCLVTRQTILFFFFFSHLNLGAYARAGFALANCDWLGRTLAFYQVFFQQERVAFGEDVSVPSKVTPGLPGWFFFLCSVQASFSWPRVELKGSTAPKMASRVSYLEYYYCI